MHWRPAGMPILSHQVGWRVGRESAVVFVACSQEQSARRSAEDRVDGRVRLSLERVLITGADVVVTTEGNIGSTRQPASIRSRRGRRVLARRQGAPQEPGRSCRFLIESRDGATRLKRRTPGSAGVAVTCRESPIDVGEHTNRTATMKVSPSEGTRSAARWPAGRRSFS